MDRQGRPAKRDGSKPYKKSGGRGFRPRNRVRTVDASTAAEDLAEYILKNLSRDPEKITINRDTREGGYIRINACCYPDVTGRLIGKGGKTITAVRTLIKSLAIVRGKRIDIDVSSTDEPNQETDPVESADD